MLQRMTCKLNIDSIEEKVFISGDALHGVIMENISSETADELHLQGLNPYSQYIEIVDNDIYWKIQTLTDEARQQIIEPLMSSSFTSFHLKRINANVTITEKVKTEIPLKDLVNLFYFGNCDRIIKIRFLTPTAFKSGGSYIFHPDLQLIFGSLMRKYNSFYEGDGDIDSDTLNIIVDNTRIVSYNLKSQYYEIGKIRIPAFRGMITIKMTGAQTLVNYTNFLLRFGEYSGVGIKSSMGMGAMKIIEKQRMAKAATND